MNVFLSCFQPIEDYCKIVGSFYQFRLTDNVVTSSRDTFRTSAFGPAMMTWHSGPARQFILTYFYSIQDIKRQVGKTPPISILMSGKTFYRLWQTINWLWSENWNINNIQPGRLAGSQLLFAQTERERERPRDLRSVADKWCRYPAFNSTLWSQHYCQHVCWFSNDDN